MTRSRDVRDIGKKSEELYKRLEAVLDTLENVNREVDDLVGAMVNLSEDLFDVADELAEQDGEDVVTEALVTMEDKIKVVYENMPTVSLMWSFDDFYQWALRNDAKFLLLEQTMVNQGYEKGDAYSW